MKLLETEKFPGNNTALVTLAPDWLLQGTAANQGA
jgi:hypothetical protein